MSEDIKQSVDPASAAFKRGVKAGLNSTEDTENWKAGNELGQELKGKGEPEEAEPESLPQETVTPLFMRDSSEGNKGNAQDEKDEVAE